MATAKQVKELEEALEGLLNWVTQHGIGESDPAKRPESRDGNPWSKVAVRNACNVLAASRGILEPYTYRKSKGEEL